MTSPTPVVPVIVFALFAPSLAACVGAAAQDASARPREVLTYEKAERFQDERAGVSQDRATPERAKRDSRASHDRVSKR